MATYIINGVSPGSVTYLGGGDANGVGSTWQIAPGWDASVNALTITITDDNTAFNGDNASPGLGNDATQTAVIQDASGAVVASGRVYLSDGYTATAADGSTIHTYNVAIGNTIYATVADQQLQPGEAYTTTSHYDVTPTNAPLYGALASQSFDPDAVNAITGGALGDTLYGGALDDTIAGGAGNDVISGGSGNDLITGGAGNDSLAGDAGSDTFAFQSGFGQDTVDGGAGSGDTNALDFSGDTVPVSVTFTGTGSGTAAGGSDSVTFTNVQEVIGTAGDDTLLGGAGNDILLGGGGNDVIGGGAGDDSLAGGAGNDLITGGGGNDTLTGGTGDDTFQLSSGGGAETITDFDCGDSNGDGFTNDQLNVSGLTDTLGDAVRTWDVAVGADGSGNAVLTFPNGESVTLLGVSVAQATASGALYSMGVPCFVAGTLIRVPGGEVPVESLRAGALVETLEHGAQPLLWAGGMRLGPAVLAARPALRPVWVGRLGISPQHAVWLPGAGLVRARHLAAVAPSLARVDPACTSVRYHHLFFARHEIVFAEGVPAESLYPGPQALAWLPPAARAAIKALFPGVPAERVAAAYGPRAGPLLSRQAVARLAKGQGLGAIGGGCIPRRFRGAEMAGTEAAF